MLKTACQSAVVGKRGVHKLLYARSPFYPLFSGLDVNAIFTHTYIEHAYIIGSCTRRSRDGRF